MRGQVGLDDEAEPVTVGTVAQPGIYLPASGEAVTLTVVELGPHCVEIVNPVIASVEVLTSAVLSV